MKKSILLRRLLPILIMGLSAISADAYAYFDINGTWSTPNGSVTISVDRNYTIEVSRKSGGYPVWFTKSNNCYVNAFGDKLFINSNTSITIKKLNGSAELWKKLSNNSNVAPIKVVSPDFINHHNMTYQPYNNLNYNNPSTPRPVSTSPKNNVYPKGVVTQPKGNINPKGATTQPKSNVYPKSTSSNPKNTIQPKGSVSYPKSTNIRARTNSK